MGTAPQLWWRLVQSVRVTLYAAVESRSDILPLAADGDAGPARKAGLRRDLQSDAGQRRSRFDLCTRPRSGLADLQLDRRARRDARDRRRTPSLRVERVQRGTLPLRTPSARRAALPDRSGTTLVAYPYHRHETGSAQSQDRQGDRARGDRRAHRLQPSAYAALRARRDLRERAGESRGRRARRSVP